MKIRIRFDDHWSLSLAFVCPSCGATQETPIYTAQTGKRFLCACGEDIRITSESLSRVQRELDTIKSFAEKDVDIPV